MEQQNYTLKQATEKFGKPRKIFDILIREKLYPVYSIEGYEHNLGKWNGCPDTWWLDYSVYHSDNDYKVPTIRELIPYIDKGVHRVCWEVNYAQFNFRSLLRMAPFFHKRLGNILEDVSRPG